MGLSDVFAALAIILGVVAVFVGALFFFALLGTMVGAFVGWVVSITPLRTLVEQGFKAFGFNAEGLLPHIGATLGFITGFLRGLIEIRHKEND